MESQRQPEELEEAERQRLEQAHQRLRNASQALQALTVIRPVRGRWAATPAPPEALDAAQSELQDAYQEIWSTQRDVLGWQPPPDRRPGL